MGAIGYVGQSLCYMSALQYASAGLVSLLLYLYPMLVTILSVLFLKEKLTKWNGLALVLATLGAALTANPQGGQWMGVLLAITAAIVYAGYIMIGSGVMAKVSAIQSSAVIFSSAALVFGGLTLLRGVKLPADISGWWVLVGMGILATLVPVSAFLAGLKRVGPRDASLLSTFEPVVTVVLAALILSEPIRVEMLLGGGLILLQDGDPIAGPCDRGVARSRSGASWRFRASLPLSNLTEGGDALTNVAKVCGSGGCDAASPNRHWRGRSGVSSPRIWSGP